MLGVRPEFRGCLSCSLPLHPHLSLRESWLLWQVKGPSPLEPLVQPRPWGKNLRLLTSQAAQDQEGAGVVSAWLCSAHSHPASALCPLPSALPGLRPLGLSLLSLCLWVSLHLCTPFPPCTPKHILQGSQSAGGTEGKYCLEIRALGDSFPPEAWPLILGLCGRLPIPRTLTCSPAFRSLCPPHPTDT